MTLGLHGLIFELSCPLVRSIGTPCSMLGHSRLVGHTRLTLTSYGFRQIPIRLVLRDKPLEGLDV